MTARPRASSAATKSASARSISCLIWASSSRASSRDIAGYVRARSRRGQEEDAAPRAGRSRYARPMVVRDLLLASIVLLHASGAAAQAGEVPEGTAAEAAALPETEEDAA